MQRSKMYREVFSIRYATRTDCYFLFYKLNRLSTKLDLHQL